MEYIEPTATSRRNLAILWLTVFGAGLLIAVFQSDILAALQSKITAMPRCDSIALLRWSILAILGAAAFGLVGLIVFALKVLRLNQLPLPGAWVFRRTPIRRGREVRLRAYALLALSAVAMLLGIRSWYLLEKSVDEMEARNCTPIATMQPNNALERARGDRGRAVLAMDCVLAGPEWAPSLAAQLGR